MYAVSYRDCFRIILRSSSYPLTYVFIWRSLDIHDSSLMPCNSFVGFSFFEAKSGFLVFFSTLCLLQNKVSLAIEDRNICLFVKPLAVALESCMAVLCKFTSEQPFRYWAPSRRAKLSVKGSEWAEAENWTYQFFGSDLSLGGRKGRSRCMYFQH